METSLRAFPGAVSTFSIIERGIDPVFHGANIPGVGAFFLMRLERQSPGKVNLVLNILGKRPDGFHELETVMQPVSVCDTLAFEPTSGRALN